MRSIVRGALCAVAFLAVLGTATTADANGFVGVCSMSNPGNCVEPQADGSLNVNGSFSATLSGFTPNGNIGTPVSATTSSSRQQLPATSAVVLVGNKGSVPAYVKLGDNTVAATVDGIMVPAGGGCALTVGSNTYIAAITASGSATLNTAGGTGLAQTCFGGGSGGGSGGTVQIDQTTPGTTNGVVVNSSALPTGAATASGQATTNSSLSNIDTNTASAATSLVGVALDATVSAPQITHSGTVGYNVYIADPSTGSPITYSNPTSVQGNTASGATASENPLLNGCRASTATPTPVTDGQKIAVMCSSLGKVVVDLYAPESLRVRGSASSTDASAHTLLPAAGSGVKNYVTGLQCSNTSATSVTITVSSSASGVFVVPAGGGTNPTFPVPLVTAANTAFTFTASSGVTTLYCNAQGYTGP
jgi:hypothetical protein